MAVSSIVMTVDRPTYQNWARSVKNLSRSFTISVNLVGHIPGFHLHDKTLQFTGLELLSEVGRACTRPHIVDDPDRLFAFFRYATKIANMSDFRLDSALSDLDTHKKRILSDEIGCGFSFMVARRMLNYDQFLDLKDAVGKGLITTCASRYLQPDYIGQSTQHQGIAVLEAKGTQRRWYGPRKQIPRGCVQVAAVRAMPGRRMVRIVVGSELHREDEGHGSKIHLGDPDEEKSHQYDFGADPEALISQNHYLRLAAFVGDTSLVEDLKEPGSHQEDSVLVSRTVDNIRCSGSLFEIQYGQSRCGFFVGLADEVRSYLMDRLDRPREGPISPPWRTSVEARPEQTHRTTNCMVGDDGLVAEVWFEGNLAGPEPHE